MYNNIISPQQDMGRSVKDNRASCSIDIHRIVDPDGQAYWRQEINLDVEMDERRTWLLPLNTFMDVDTDLTGVNEK